MRVAAVIPNWNGAPLLAKLLPTLAAQSRPFDSVLVVDNGSTDDSVAVATGYGAHTVRLPSNRGFAAAVNRGAEQASDADILAILNNDVELDPEWLTHGLARFRDEGISFVGGKTLSTLDGAIIDGAFDALCRGACALRCGAGEPDGAYWATSRRIQMAPMTAMLIRRDVFLQLGGLDEAFESYMEDVDFGLRCASNGYSGVYEPAMIARHLGSATLGAWNAKTVRNIARNQILVVARHYDTATLWRFGWPIAVAQGLWGLVAVRHGRGRAWLAGKIEGVRAFRTFRRSGSSAVAGALIESERTLFEVCQASRCGWYWRLYFALTARVPGRSQ